MIFLSQQIKDIAKKGAAVATKKIRSLFLLTLAFIAIILVRLLRPVILFRFAPLDSDRIGNFAVITELYLCERDLGVYGKRVVDIFYNRSSISNEQLRIMWARILRIHSFSRFLDRVNSFIPGGEKHSFEIGRGQLKDFYQIGVYNKPHLKFSNKEEICGKDYLYKLGLPEKAAFVCFHVRDSSYLDTVYPNKDWSYHNCQDCNVENFTPAIEELTKRGLFALRMGSVVKKALKSSNPRVIDYASNGRDDFLDIYLSAKCRFFLATASGLSSLPIIFRRPVAWSNFLPLDDIYTWAKDHLFIFKKLWLRKEQRFMTFQEMIDTGAGRFARTEEFEKAGIDVVENTPLELTSLVIEMDDKIRGNWKPSKEDGDLQKHFWSIIRPNLSFNNINIRAGAEFLRGNKELF
ncbi:MAG: TIGR04372 family glycosyltransferase [Candidatus Omnitrophica bacterium]|nr:TIGR04372 family glycosyltransferase [Candidatus Omnitrophota bacterium]